jgi:hypothetical protein
MRKNRLVDFLTLFTSAGTLICCALPALLVTIGAGSVMAGLVSNVPQLIWFSKHKVEIFIFAGIMLMLSGSIRLYSKNLSCPIDENLEKACSNTRKLSNRIFVFSILIYLTGGFFAFLAPRIL